MSDAFTPEEQQFLEAWQRECAEWLAIRDELVGARAGKIVTAHQVTVEQRKRQLARGEPPPVLPSSIRGSLRVT
jgi:hypothetical protein